jgi:4-hydroxy-4-methyl-2-oxoglutarate aldolase
MLDRLAELSTVLVADACVRLHGERRLVPPGLRPVVAGSRVAGRALPVRHYGSVDVFLEALGEAEEGDVLVLDNRGRTREACIGDLVVLEAKAAGIAGLVVWGLKPEAPAPARA